MKPITTRKDKDYILKITGINFRGYGLAQLENKEFQVLNALPGETVEATVFKKKKNQYFALTKDILVASSQRKEPLEDHFLASAPWQIMDFAYENQLKLGLIQETFLEQSGLIIPQLEVVNDPMNTTNYRNKVEYSFYAYPDETISLAYFKREGNFAKYPHTGSLLVAEPSNLVAGEVVNFLNQEKITARQVKSLIIRYSFWQKKVVASLFLKDENLRFDNKKWQELVEKSQNYGLQGLQVVFSSPKSPASIISQSLFEWGDLDLKEKIADLELTYPVHGFFQINPSLFSKTLETLQNFLNLDKFKNLTLVDLYSGVGTLGLALAKKVKHVIGVEIFPESQKYADQNALQNHLNNFEFIEKPAEKVLDILNSEQILLVDPPRSGLHPKLISKILEIKPNFLIYLSCNPETQARDINLLKSEYKIISAKAFNFYPQTPHVENLLFLERL